jgi:tripartite ATP-independent transporter DctM subunit
MALDVIAVVVLLGTFFLLMILRVSIAIAMGMSALVTLMYLKVPLAVVFQGMVSGTNSFTFLAVPFFIIAGELMAAGGISRRLIDFSNSLVGWMRGGLAHVNIVASMFFGGISGSAAADTASLGSILIPMMKENGYDGEFSTCVTISSSVQGMLIPPSHNMVMYAVAAGSGVSISALFLAGFAPGIILGLALMVYSYFAAIKKNYPVGDAFSLRRAIKTGASAAIGLFTVVIVVLGVVGGIVTPTESAAFAALYAFIVAVFVYREMPIKDYYKVATRTAKTLSVIMILIATSYSFGWVVTYLGIPKALTNAILTATSNKYVILFIVNILLLVLGMVMSMGSIILILTPILVPIVTAVGVDPVHFGVIMILNLGMGLLTPPVGGVLYIGSSISGIKVEKLTRAMIPFYFVMFGVLMLITYLPAISMTIPKLLR